MNVIFATDKKIWSVFIRWFTWSKYSHVALVNGDKVIEATLAHGVRMTSLDNFLSRYKKTLMCDVTVVDEEKAWNFALKQICKPYDISAIIGLALRRKWTNDDKWFCSELVVASLYQGGVTLIRKDTYRVTPEDILNSPLVKIVEQQKEKDGKI
jgi:uncharacterized protein YycO